jgi:mannose-6-phosphate isomerase-like protein (cupin superfamily)
MIARVTRSETRVVSHLTVQLRPWGEGCRSWDLVDHPHLLVVEEEMPPNTCEVRHLHRLAHQVFYVLKGALEIEMADRLWLVEAGALLEVAPGIAHSIRNTAPVPARFLAIAGPSAKGDRVATPSSDRPQDR